MIASAPHAIAITSGPSHLLLRVNSAFCGMMGALPEDVLGRPYADAFPEPLGGGPVALLEQVYSTGRGRHDEEMDRPRADGESAVWSYTVWPLMDGASGTAGLMMEVRDRTHEARSTRQLREMADQIRLINERLIGSALREQEWAERAEAAARARTDFLAMMSHELRTPLNGIIGHAEILLSGYLGPPNERQRESLERITLCSDHLLEMINDVLSFSRVEAERVQPHPARVDLGRIAREVAAIVEPLAVKKGLGLRVEIPDAPLQMETDAHMVRQILLNLAGNAVKFTDHGEVHLEVGEDTLDQARVCMRVRDTGIGIRPEDLERIFEPFVQGEAVFTRRFEGAGLGLSISRALATVLGGALTVESALGHGATFTVRLPRGNILAVATAD